MLRIAVLSDTHAPRFWKRCPEPVARVVDGVDLILHAGDICTADVLDELSAFAPVRAVKGNNDGFDVIAWGAAPETLEINLEGVNVAMIHDSGPRPGRLTRMKRRFPTADLLVYGHSHIPLDDEGSDGLVLLNPGSPTDKRRQPHKTMALVELSDGVVVDHRIVIVD